MAEYSIDLKLTPDQLLILKANLAKPQKILNQLGRFILEEAQDAFSKQAFDGQKWLPRYPNQSTNFVNLAGAVEDLSYGPTIQSKRFQNQPVGINTGKLLGSLTAGKALQIDSRGMKVIAKTNYAEKFHDGGQSTQQITPDIKKNLSTWLSLNRTDPARSRLRGLLKLTELKTESPPRPFLGLTKKTSERFVNWFKENIARY